MSELTEEFKVAFDHAMIFEVGTFFNPEDADVIAGAIGTREQRRKVGYVNIPGDRGGETKYGIALNANPDLNIPALDLEGAMEVYYKRYWLTGACDKMSYPLTIIHFDGCVNHGIKRANKFLQAAVGAVADGAIGPATLRAIQAADQEQVIRSVSQQRANFYNAIVERDPVQAKFLKGWMARIKSVTDYTLSKI